MCGLCGALGGGLAWEQDGLISAEPRAHRRREAVATAVELTRLLRPLRIAVDAHPDFGFLLSFPTGGTQIAAGLADVWHMLERGGVCIPDPLQP